ncbi:DUF7134 domain-containing protein [Streptomyces diacarni]|uniref:DUF7134 domain-containing protein n=1 Tax=Streptomyces diacarni TaxID=2800381 RepID=UPI001FE4E039|nr:hypothetical protein [Streptomyces diacarni]
MGDAARRRPVMFDALAALGFSLLPQVAVVCAAVGDEVSATAVWLLSLCTALPLVARRLWPVPVFCGVLTVACAALAVGLGPVPFLAAAYALYPVATSRRRQRGLSAAGVAVLCAVTAALLTVTEGEHYQGGSMAVQAVFALLLLGAAWAAAGERRERSRHASGRRPNRRRSRHACVSPAMSMTSSPTAWV